jgi:hypothetical protein
MYAAPVYGYGPNPNGTPSQQQQPHNPHQPGQQQQPQPHMMFNPQQQQQQQQQQYAAAAAAGVGSHQSPYGAQGGPGTMGMMQNNGLAHAGPHGMLRMYSPLLNDLYLLESSIPYSHNLADAPWQIRAISRLQRGGSARRQQFELQ